MLASGLLASAASVPGPDIAKVRNSGLRSGGEAQQQQPGLQQPRGQRQENCAADTGTSGVYPVWIFLLELSTDLREVLLSLS